LKTRIFIFDREETERLDKYLAQELPDISRSQVQRLIGEGYILLNGTQPVKNGVFLKKDDHITVYLPPPEPINLIPEDIPLDIIHEDDRVIVINKPAGMVVHPSAGHYSGTMVHALLAHAPFLGGIGGKQRPGIVHRLDKNTSGLIIVAKDDKNHNWLQGQFKFRKVEKIYFALVDGHPPTANGIIKAPIYRDRSDRKRMAIAPPGKGKSAETRFYLEKRFKNHSFMRVHLKTGRTHQIRVHLGSLKIPVTGDTVYGYSTPSIAIDRLFLHATKLKICLPGDKKKSEFNALLPDELQLILNDLEQ